MKAKIERGKVKIEVEGTTEEIKELINKLEDKITCNHSTTEIRYLPCSCNCHNKQYPNPIKCPDIWWEGRPWWGIYPPYGPTNFIKNPTFTTTSDNTNSIVWKSKTGDSISS